MKKTLILFIAFFLFIGVRAEEQVYTIKNLNMQLTFGEDWLVVTRDNYKNNSELTELGVTEEMMLSFFTANDVYLDSKKDELEFVVISRKIEFDYTKGTLGDYSDEDIKKFASEWLNKTGASSYDVVNTKDLKLINIYYEHILDEETYWVNDFITFYNGKTITFKAQQNEEFSEKDKEEILDIIKSLNVSKIKHYTPDNVSKNIVWEVLIGASIGCGVGITTYFISKKKKLKKK